MRLPCGSLAPFSIPMYQGVLNVRALSELIMWQRVQYNFQFHRNEFQADLPVLVLSEGRSIFTVRLHSLQGAWLAALCTHPSMITV